MTPDQVLELGIIPLREKIGNYDSCNSLEMVFTIIPLREKIGNYDGLSRLVGIFKIIPLREKIGNYDIKRYRKEAIKNYTTTRENWELRPVSVAIKGL